MEIYLTAVQNQPQIAADFNPIKITLLTVLLWPKILYDQFFEKISDIWIA